MVDGATRRAAVKGATDGRIRRSERSRRAITEALFELVGEGELCPTAQRVAERAGVGIRTVFRHFSDMETLFTELDARLRSDLGPVLLQPTHAGSIASRARELTRRRAALFERIAPYKRSGELQRWKSAVLQRQHRAFQRSLRTDLLRWLPELSAADSDLLEALDAALSFEAWDRLRSEQRLGSRRAAAVMQRSIESLVIALVQAKATDKTKASRAERNEGHA